MNGYGFAAGTFAGMAAAVVQKLAFPGVPEYVAFLSVSFTSLSALVATSMLTTPTPHDTLSKFYSITRPFGLWRP